MSHPARSATGLRRRFGCSGCGKNNPAAMAQELVSNIAAALSAAAARAALDGQSHGQYL